MSTVVASIEGSVRVAQIVSGSLVGSTSTRDQKRERNLAVGLIAALRGPRATGADGKTNVLSYVVQLVFRDCVNTTSAAGPATITTTTTTTPSLASAATAAATPSGSSSQGTTSLSSSASSLPGCPLPDVGVLRAAGSQSLDDVDADLKRLEAELTSCMKKADMVIAATDDEARGARFRDEMDTFTSVARAGLADQRAALEAARSLFNSLVKLYRFKSKNPAGPTINEFFDIWASFTDAFAESWAVEQKSEAKRRFEEAQAVLRQQREQAKTKKDEGTSVASKLKKRFSMKG